MTPHYADDWLTVYEGDAATVLSGLDASSVHCCVTSPPYWGLRDYGTATWSGGDEGCDHSVSLPDADNKAVFAERVFRGDRTTCVKCGATRIDSQLGLEATPEEYVVNLVGVFREVRRVLRDDGTLWLNLGDSYAGSGKGRSKSLQPAAAQIGKYQHHRPDLDVKPKDLVGIPWLVARALQEPFYTGRIKRERDRTWLAAMIDGEGTICGFDHDRADDGSHRSGVHVAITNTSTALLDEAARIWPTSRSAHQTPHAGHLGTKDSWRWIVHGIENKMAALTELYPYLIAKQQQAVVGYTLLTLMADAKRLGHSSQKDAVLAKRRVLTGLLSDLNHQRPVVMPSWMVEPPSLYEPGWYLRSDIIWAKPNPMPESVTDRPTKAHEYLFLLSKSARYFYDADAVAEPASYGSGGWEQNGAGSRLVIPGQGYAQHRPRRSKVRGEFNGKTEAMPGRNAFRAITTTRNLRSVWTIATRPYPGAHFAVFPPELPERCIKAGSSERGVCPECGAPWERVVDRQNESTYARIQRETGTTYKDMKAEAAANGITPGNVGGTHAPGRRGAFYEPPDNQTTGWLPSCGHPSKAIPATILDPFAGSGTVGLVANRLSRRAVLIDLNPQYLEQQMQRNAQVPVGL